MASGADSYDPVSGQLTIPSLVIGSTTFSDLVVKVGNIVTLPSGTYANFPADSFSTETQQLSVSTVIVGTSTYFNPVVTLTGIVSIGGVAGADTYDGANLAIPAVQLLGGAVYTNVVVPVTLGNVVRVGGGMPTVSQNQYDAGTHRLTIPVATFGGRVYTNVVVGVGQVKSVGGSQLTDSVSWSFSGHGGQTGSADGGLPYANLVQGADGNFYGTTNYGGAHDAGTVFRLTPGGAETVLYSFAGDGGVTSLDGANPQAALVSGTDGNLYGTTANGGAVNQGTVFRITADGTETVIHSFLAPTEGGYPNGLVLGPDGNFYGTNFDGGPGNEGTVFRITPNGTLTVLYAFGSGGATDSGYPYAALMLGGDGSFYGTTTYGGPSLNGTIFRITPNGVETLLYAFGANGAALDGAQPYSSLVQGGDGNFYGTTNTGGANGVGTVFKMTPAGAESVIYSFAGDGGIGGSIDGALPYSGLALGSDGNFYGTTNNGGAYNGGTVFRITPAGVETELYSFSGAGGLAGSADGAYPNGAIFGADGSLYAMTYNGGTYNEGAVVKLAVK